MRISRTNAIWIGLEGAHHRYRKHMDRVQSVHLEYTKITHFIMMSRFRCYRIEVVFGSCDNFTKDAQVSGNGRLQSHASTVRTSYIRRLLANPTLFASGGLGTRGCCYRSNYRWSGDRFGGPLSQNPTSLRAQNQKPKQLPCC